MEYYMNVYAKMSQQHASYMIFLYMLRKYINWKIPVYMLFSLKQQT